MKECFLKAKFIYSKDSEYLLDEIKSINPSSFEFILFEDFIDSHTTEDEHIVIALETSKIKKLFYKAIKEGFSIAIIPLKNQKYFQDIFMIPLSLKDSLDAALHKNYILADVLYCNEEMVLFSAHVGEIPLIGISTSKFLELSFIKRISLFFKHLKKIPYLTPKIFSLKTKKGQNIETIALGVSVIEYDNKTLASKLLQDSLSIQDGQSSAMIASPKSIIDYIKFLIYSIFFNKIDRLPDGFGYVKSEEIEISLKSEIGYVIDGEKRGAKSLKFETQKRALKLVVGEKFKEQKSASSEQKETLKIDKLRSKEESITLMQKPLTFFTQASEEDFKRVFVSLRDDSKASSSYYTMMLLSSLLATVGIFLDSPAVVIGAMILAPLMSPIVSLSMGVLRKDREILRDSIFTITKGLLFVLCATAFLTYLLPYEKMTDELNARLSPSLLDLAVAIFSGVAAAYAKHNEKVMKTVAGVAIAVALIPPLSVVGIGVGWGDFYIISNAMLLFLTNLFGITLAASISFMVFGFSPIKKANGIGFLSILLFIIAIPLFYSFTQIIDRSNLERKLINKEIKFFDEKIKIVSIQSFIRDGDEALRVEILTQEILTKRELQEIKKEIVDTIEREVIVEFKQIAVIK